MRFIVNKRSTNKVKYKNEIINEQSCWGNQTANERKGAEPRMSDCVTRKFVDFDVWKWNYNMKEERVIENKSGKNR